jgi:AcrR family transcriptional regulator
MINQHSPGAARPGGRTARTRDAVCRTTLHVLAEKGYSGLTVDIVAERAGVHRTTIYRRWGGVDGLVVDALQYAIDDDWQPDLSGTVDENLYRFTQGALEAFTDPETGPTHTAVVAAAFQSERAIDAVHAFFEDRFGRAAKIVETGITRGELPESVDPVSVIRAVIAPIYFRLFISREPVREHDLDQAVRAALVAARAGIFSSEG